MGVQQMKISDGDFDIFLKKTVYCDGKHNEIDQDTRKNIRDFVDEIVVPNLVDKNQINTD